MKATLLPLAITCALAAASLGVPATGPSTRPAEHDGLACWIESNGTTFEEWQSIDFYGVVRNVGDHAIVLPSGSIRLKLEGAGARYGPAATQAYSSPPVVLKPGDECRRSFLRLGDDAGTWGVGKGRITAHVTCDSRRAGYIWDGPEPKWVGVVEAHPLVIERTDNSPTYKALVAAWSVRQAGGEVDARKAVLGMGARAEQELLKMLHERYFYDQGHRGLTIWGLGVLHSKEALPDLLLQLSTADASEAMGALTEMGKHEETMKALDAMLSTEPMFYRRLHMVHLLGQMRQRDPENAAIRSMLQKALKDDNERVREAAGLAVR